MRHCDVVDQASSIPVLAGGRLLESFDRILMHLQYAYA
jgi:hypothetical protein